MASVYSITAETKTTCIPTDFVFFPYIYRLGSALTLLKVRGGEGRSNSYKGGSWPHGLSHLALSSDVLHEMSQVPRPGAQGRRSPAGHGRDVAK